MPTNADALGTEQAISYDKLVSMDKPSLVALGMFGAEAIRRSRVAVFQVDVLGRVQLLPPEAVRILEPARVVEAELDGLDEDRAIEIMAAQGDSEETILDYLKARKRRGHGGEGL